MFTSLSHKYDNFLVIVQSRALCVFILGKYSVTDKNMTDFFTH